MRIGMSTTEEQRNRENFEEFQNLMFQSGTSSWGGTIRLSNTFTKFSNHRAGGGIFQKMSSDSNVESAHREFSE